MDKQIVNLEDRSVTSEQVELPYFYPYLHQRENWQITWVQEGHGTLIVGNTIHKFQAGDIFLIGADLPHLFKNPLEYFAPESDRSVKACNVYFNANFMSSSFFDVPEMRAAKAFLEKNRHGFIIPKKYVNKISDSLQSIHLSSGISQVCEVIKLFGQLLQINDALPLCADVYAPYVNEKAGVRLTAVVNYIIKNFAMGIRLEDVAAESYFSPSAFCRYFKKHTGRSYVTFLNEVRINHACEKLVAQGKSDAGYISTVAYTSGFSTLPHFNRIFKKVVGFTPSDYLKAYGANNIHGQYL